MDRTMGHGGSRGYSLPGMGRLALAVCLAGALALGCGDDGQEPLCDCTLDEECIDGVCVPLLECEDDGDCEDDEECDEGACKSRQGPDPECIEDGDCSEGYCDDDGACQEGCLDDDHCPEGHMCDTDAAVCVQCLDDQDCEDDEYCDASSCLQGCREGSCDDGVCDIESRQCVACLGDTDCQDGWTCGDDATCWECRRDADCVEGTCNQSSHLCEALLPGCQDDMDCDPGEICITETSTCREGCRQDDACEAGLLCHPTDLICMNCATHEECGQGRYCSNDGLCLLGCGDAEDCPGQVCDMEEHACVGCLSDGDCTDGTICEDAACRNGCRESADCTVGLVCDVSLWVCSGCQAHEQCADGEACLDTVCVLGCREDLDCGLGFTCNPATASCQPVGPRCTTDGECPSDQYCDIDAGDCFPGCRPLGCPDDQFCNTTTRICEAGCEDNDGCDEGFECLEHQCVGGCQGDEDCNHGEICNDLTSICEPGCRDDDHEPNSSSASPSPLYEDITGLVICGDDEDWFVVDLEEGAGLRVVMNHDYDLGDLDMDLYMHDGATMLDRSDSAGDQEEVTLDLAPEAGNYLVRVYGIAMERNIYDISLTITPPALACTDDAMEPNGSLAEAAPLTENGEWDLTLCSGDEDWYAVALEEGDAITATIAFDGAQADLDLELIDPNGTVLDRSDTTGDQEEVANPNVFEAGEYLIRVFAAGPGLDATYSLTLNVVPADPPCDDDPFEPNESALEPTVLNLPLEQTSYDLTLCAGDEDWFVVTLQAGDSLSAVATFNGEAVDIDLELTCPQGGEPCQVSSSSSGREELSMDDVGQGGEYLIRVHHALVGLAADYRMVFDVQTVAGPCADDFHEPNDVRGEAADLAAGTYAELTVCADDEDWYALTLDEESNVTATISFVHAAGDLDMELYLGDEMLPLDRSETEGDGESVGQLGLDAGVYYVRVYGFDGAENDYTMTIEIRPTLAECTDDGFESNDSPEEATAVGAQTYANRQLCPGNEDWYMVTLEEAADLVVTIAFYHFQGDIDMLLLDESLNTLDESFSTSDDEEVSLLGAAPGVYYIRVLSLSPATSNHYDLTVQY